jgi:hypothetical protein
MKDSPAHLATNKQQKSIREQRLKSSIHFVIWQMRREEGGGRRREAAIKEIFMHPTGGGVSFVKINSNLIK